MVCAVVVSWQCLHRPRPYWGSSGLSPRAMRSRRSCGWWSATVAMAMSQSTQMGSRVSTCVLNLRCPAVAYGLPSGLRSCSAVPLHLGQRPVPWCRSGQAGLVHTRHAAVTGSILAYGTACPSRWVWVVVRVVCVALPRLLLLWREHYRLWVRGQRASVVARVACQRG